MGDIKVTVFCMTYNHEKYIRDALNGFVMQETDFAFEVLVHDDASTDNTAKIIREYEKKYPDIIKPIYQTENQQQRGTRVTYTWLLPNAKGKYIALCEGDDYWTDSRKLQRQYDYMEAHAECSLVAHRAKILFMDTMQLVDYTQYDFEKKGYDLSLSDMMNDSAIFPWASMFLKKEFYIRNQQFLLNVKNFDFLIKSLLAMEGNVHVLSTEMCVYRKGTVASWTKKVAENEEQYAEHIETSIDIFEKLNDYTSNRYENEIREVIYKRRFQLYMLIGDINALKTDEFMDEYVKLSALKKLSLYIKKYFPFLYSFLRKIYKRLKKGVRVF